MRFIDWLNQAGQRWWQILPLGPPDRFGSPYAARSAFACSPALLDRPEARVTTSELDGFLGEHAYWAEGWARYGGRGAIEDQVRFEREWSRLRAHAAERGVQILGDMPFYVARDSADHREHPELFDGDRSAGVPPDDWSATGQLWGNPTYNWRAMRKDGFRWWIERFRRTFQLVDAARVDHFRGFVSCWSVPYGNRTAEDGSWRRSPGGELFAAVEAELGRVRIAAENLGLITPPVERLRLALRIPGTMPRTSSTPGRTTTTPRLAGGGAPAPRPATTSKRRSSTLASPKLRRTGSSSVSRLRIRRQFRSFRCRISSGWTALLG